MHTIRRMKASCLLFLSIHLSSLLAVENDFGNYTKVVVHTMKTEHKNHLIELAQGYLKFVHDVGSAGSVQPDDVRIKSLFAKNLTKTDNRSVLFEGNRDLLLPQMRGFEKEYNPESKKADWVVDIANALIIPSTETNSVVIYFEWTHVNVGRATTMVVLQCNENNQIARIIDVWAKVLN